MKKSSYQKLKEENKRLRSEIHVLVNEPKSIKAIELQVIYSRPVMTPILFGKPNGVNMNGIFNQIKTVNYNPEILKEAIEWLVNLPELPSMRNEPKMAEIPQPE